MGEEEKEKVGIGLRSLLMVRTLIYILCEICHSFSRL